MGTTITDALTTTDEVAGLIGTEGVRLLEVDEDTGGCGGGHLSGALGVHWKNDLQDPVRRDFIGARAFGALMDRLGIANDTRVVLYGGNNNWFAAYAYWYFRYYGHQAVRLMDGGRKKWELEGRPMTTEVVYPSPRRGYRTDDPAERIRARRHDVETVLASGGASPVDGRSPEEDRGEPLAPAHLPQEGAPPRRAHPRRAHNP